MSTDNTTQILQQVEQTLQAKQQLSIHGSGSHDFMLPDYKLDHHIYMAAHSGIIDYQPSELTLKARAGTPLIDIQQTLAEQHQRLATDIPMYNASATLGGALAIGHTGSGRPFLGALRDHILGVGLINGQGQHINCGGQVMKNVAGYDVSRLMSGSRGTLGPILDITVKVLPQPESQQTHVLEMEENQAIEMMNKMAGTSLPLTACAFYDGKLHVRLEGSASGVSHAADQLGGSIQADAGQFWSAIQNQQFEFFAPTESLWRIVVPTTTPRLELERDHRSLIDWCGGLRWIHADEITQSDFIHVSNMGGYIENFRGGPVTHPAELMTELQKQMHMKIKRALDPSEIFNPALSSFQ